MYITRIFVCLILTGLFACAAPALASPPPGGEGYVTFLCNIDGAVVSLDGNPVGTITDGSLDVPDASQYSSYVVAKDGYYDESGTISFVPGGPANLEISITLEPRPVGSGKGWLKVSANIAGASVAFNGISQGVMTETERSFEVSTTGTPYTRFTVSKPGYVSYEGQIARMPADGETVRLYATLNPLPTTVPTTVPAPVGGDEGWYAVVCNVDGAAVYFDSAYKGTISAGSLTVPVYSTGTPYRTWRVEKSGYMTSTGTLPAAPAKGRTVTVSVTLSPVVTEAPTAQPTTAAPGSEKGYIVIHANVEGATVTVGSSTVGTIRNGILRVPVSTTGTPYSAFTVSKAGYTTATGTVPRQPAAGETVDLYVTLSPAPPAPVPTPESPLPLPVVGLGILVAVLMWARRS